MSVIHVTSKSSLDQVVAEMDRRGSVIEQLEARIRALEAIPQGAIDALRKNQRQLDMDGCEVGVSRQAIDEVLTGLDAAPASLAPQGETSHGANPARVVCKTCGQSFDLSEPHDCPGLLAANPAQMTDASDDFSQYRRKQVAELRPWVSGDDMSRISVSAPDKEAGSPKAGDMIARNPKNHDDQWLVAAAYFADNFEPLTAAIGAGGQAVAVKPLEWSDKGWCWQAFPEIGEYRVEDQGLNWNVDRFWVSYRGEILGKFADSDDALAAAQADYERRIRSALSQPHPADERVVEALRKKIAAIPKFDRGYSWEQSDYRGVEAIRAYGPIAAMCKFVLDNTEHLLAALSAKEGR